MNRTYLDDLARIVTRTGRLLLENGAEVYRVEDSMYYLCAAYGASTIDAYATPTVLIISFTLDGELSHNVKRIKKANNNLRIVDKVNDLVRKVCADPIDIADFAKKLDEIEDEKPYPNYCLVLSSMLACFGFGIFYGGKISEVYYATLLGIIVELLLIGLKNSQLNNLFSNALTSAFLSICGILLSYFKICDGNIVIISVIMLLVPGMLITNAIRDAINGDLNSSMYRFLQALLISISVGLGSALAYIILGGIL